MTSEPSPGRRRTGAIWAAGIIAGIGAGVAAERILMRRAVGRPDPERGVPLDTVFGEPRTVESFDGTPIHVRVAGPESGPTVVFSHGVMLDLTLWHYQWRALADRYRCVFYDQRGHGRSGTSPAGDYSVRALGGDLRAVLDATGPRGPAVLVGHSMGGMSILSLADDHPEEFGGRVGGVVLVDTTASDLVREAAGRLGARAERLLRPARAWLTSDLARVDRIRRRIQSTGSDFAYVATRLSNFGPNASPAQVQHVSRLAMRVAPEVWAHTIASLIDLDLRHALEHIVVPALVVVGDADRLTPKTSAQALLRSLPDGRGALITGAGHLTMMERHEAFNALLERFLSETFAAAGAPSRKRRTRRTTRARSASA